MAKLRSVSVNFWDDPFIEELSTSEKLLFLYLITNDKTNMIGVYESSSKKMSFETGIPQSNIETILGKFEKAKKIKRVGSYVVVLNFIKNQNFNPNMMKSAIDTYNALPNELKANDLIVGKESLSNGLERVRNGLAMVRKVEYEYEVEVEVKDEVEYESKTKSNGGVSNAILYPSFDDFWNAYDKKVERAETEKKWLKLTQTEKEKIMSHVARYVVATPNSQYRKNPTTYLNQKTYLDEIVIPQSNGSTTKLSAADKHRESVIKAVNEINAGIDIPRSDDIFRLPPPVKNSQ